MSENLADAGYRKQIPDALLKLLTDEQDQLTPPIFSSAEIIEVKSETDLSALGIRFVDNVGVGNKIIVDKGQSRLDLSISFNGCRGSALVIGKGALLSGNVRFRGNDSACCFASVGGAQGPNRVDITISAHRAVMYFGKDTTFVTAQFLLEGDGKKIVVMDDCMFSWGIFVRNYDSHSIFDIHTQAVINDAADLRIASHVWVGQDAFLARGVSIGAGSIIGARSTVLADIPATVAVAGTPARIIRSGVSWSRQRFATPNEIAAALNRLRALTPSILPTSSGDTSS